MRRFFCIIVVIVISAFNSFSMKASFSLIQSEDETIIWIADIPQNKIQDCLRDTNDREHKFAEAILSDAHEANRICNSRPQRLQPHCYHKNEASYHTINYSNRRTSNTFSFSGKQRIETAPFQSHASCEYYIFTLRHILR